MSTKIGLPPGLTLRSLISGFLFAMVLCGMNSYLTLSFGVIEEGPTIAALFFFAIFVLSKTKITTSEMVIVATMGSAGGSLGFISNFYAAQAINGEPFSITQMALFGIVSSLVGLVMVVPLRQLLVLRGNLPWPGAKAVQSVIRALVEHGDPRQAVYLAVTFGVAAFYVVGNKDAGLGWFPAEVHLPGLAMVGGAVAGAPFALGGSYLMGLRTCVGFLAGAIILMALASSFPLWPVGSPEAATAALAEPVSPNGYYWPGLGFLVSSGLTVMAVNWRSITGAFASMLNLRGARGDGTVDDDPIMSGKTLAAFAVVAFAVAAVVLNVYFAISVFITAVLVLVGGLIQNMIATRAQAQTAFNPARVMGILLQGVTTAAGGSQSSVNLAGAGFVAGSGAQAGNLTGDMAYGRELKVPSRWQFWAQSTTVIPCAIVSAYVFDWVRTSGKELGAPIAKMWAASSLIFDKGFDALPPGALEALGIGAAIGVVYALLELIPALARFMPETIGIGLGLVLHPSLSLAFFVGGFFFWVVLARGFKIKDVTLTTIAVGCIVAEGIGGVLKPILSTIGVPGFP